MKLVKLNCRHCDNTTDEFAINFFPDEETTIKETQQHINLNFKAMCGQCWKNDWEVIGVRIQPRVFPMGVRK